MIFSDEQKEYIYNNSLGKTNKELTIALNNLYHSEFTVKQVKWFKYTHHINSGLKKRNLPIGSERIKNGYIFIKTEEPSLWKEKHRVIYESVYGEIPEGYKIMFLDGDKLNCNIDNLKLVKDSEEIYINKNGFAGVSKEITETAINLAKLKTKLDEV